MASTYTPIATTTASGSTATITFSSISGTYTDLILVINGYMASGGYFDIQMGNGSVDTGANYSYTRLYGDGSSAGSNRASNTSYIRASLSTSLNATSIINFQNYANSSVYRTVLLRYSSTNTEAAAVVGTWRNSSSAINTISLVGAGNWNSSTTFTLYGIKAA